MIVALLLAALGLGFLVLGVSVWRKALKVVQDARRQLEGMFGDSMPGVFAEEPNPLGARIGGACIAALGLGMIVGAVVALVVG